MLLTSAIVLILFLLIACSSGQDVYISGTGEGTISIDVNLDNMVIQYSRDLLGGFSNTKAEDIRLFDINKISYIVSELESVALTGISSDSQALLHL